MSCCSEKLALAGAWRRRNELGYGEGETLYEDVNSSVYGRVSAYASVHVLEQTRVESGCHTLPRCVSLNLATMILK